MRIVSVLVAVGVVAVFLLPSTIAIYAAVNGTAWDLQDIQTFPTQLLISALALFAVAGCSVRRVVALLKADATHPLVSVPLFELDCALIR